MKPGLPFILAFCLSHWLVFSFGQSESHHKINGISVWSDITPREAKDYAFVEKTNANWVSIQPYGVVMTDSSGVEYNREDIWESSSYKGTIKHIAILHQLGYRVFLKPHLIIKYKKPGVWVGNLKLDTEEKWQTFEQSYLEYVISLAHIADSMEVELFSLGTELGTFPQQRSDFWLHMIDTVRSIYDGGLTFCANFDAYQEFPFWNKVDLMSIDAYFTIDNSKHPTLEKCRKGWKKLATELEQYSSTTGKKILFSEFGYQSADFCALKPFGGVGSSNVNLVAQANAYRAVFDVVWGKPWFVGGFSWVWRFDNDHPENYDNTSFSPQNKPAANIIAKNYLLYR